MLKTKKPQADNSYGFVYATLHKFSSYYRNYNSNRFESQSKLFRVNKNHPCSICEKNDWCSYTDDGNLALCMRISDGSKKTASNGAFIHILNPYDKKRTSTFSTPTIRKSGNIGKSKFENFRANAEQTNEVYDFLLSDLTLSEKHANNLLYERGLSDSTIASKLYASVPSESNLAELMKQLREKFGDRLKGIAGFYRDESGIWQFNKPRGGLLIPYRNEIGQIQALQARLGITKSRYIWVSSNPEDEKFKDGTSSGAPLHLVLPDLVEKTGEIIITEGALKADCIAEFTGKSVVALAGVACANFNELTTYLRHTFPHLRTVIVAYDADFVENENVKSALLKLARVLKESGLEGGVWHWDLEHGKGLDDLLLADNREVENEQ